MPQPRVQRYSPGESAIFSNAYLVELDSGVVVVDSTLTVSGGKALNRMVRDTKKPLLAVLLTHGHPDHYNGVVELVSDFGDVPVISVKGVDEVIRKHDAGKERQWKSTFGDEWPVRRAFPNRIVGDGGSLDFGQVRFTVHDLGPGESHSDSYWVMEYNHGGRKVVEAFIGDVVLNQVHAYLSDGHSSEWLRNIGKLKSQSKGFRILYPGHGEPGGMEILDWQKSYIEFYREKVASLSGGKPSLSETAKQQLVSEMRVFLQNGKLEFLIALGADPVAAEMAKR